MATTLVVADDLTGANAAAAAYARAGLRAVTVGLHQRWDAIAEFHSRFDVVVATTDSRHSPPDMAADRIRTAVQAGWPAEFVSCRIDTTLRGNVAVSAKTVLDTVRGLVDRPVLGICAPAHPDAGRQTVNGHQWLFGEPLEFTELARDPRSPMSTSSLTTLLGDLRTATVPLEAVVREPAAAIERAWSGGAVVVVLDALTTAHLATIARAAVEVARRHDLQLVGIDPGPASTLMAVELGLASAATSAPLLAVSGSATRLTRQQLQHLVSSGRVTLVRPVLEPGTPLTDVDATLPLVLRALADGAPVLVAGVLSNDDVRPVTDDQAAEIPRRLGRLARLAMAQTAVGGLYTTGGDITSAVLEELDARGLEIEGEVIPLAVSGFIVGGSWSGLPIITKGGLIGNQTTAEACLDRLADLAQQRRRRATAGVPREPLGVL